MDNVFSSVFSLLGFVILSQKKLTKYKSCLRKSTVLFFTSPEFIEELKNSRPNIHISVLSHSKMGPLGPRRAWWAAFVRHLIIGKEERKAR